VGLRLDGELLDEATAGSGGERGLTVLLVWLVVTVAVLSPYLPTQYTSAPHLNLASGGRKGGS
jgi:hypothetical protein